MSDRLPAPRWTRPRPAGSPPSDLLQSVERACRILRAVGAGKRGLTTVEIAEVCELPVPTVRHQVVSLAWMGMVRRWDPDGRYTLGPAVADLSRDLLLQVDGRLKAGVSRQEVADALGRPLEWVDMLLEG